MLDGVIERRPADDGKSLRLAWKYSVVESVARNAPCPCGSGKNTSSAACRRKAAPITTEARNSPISRRVADRTERTLESRFYAAPEPRATARIRAAGGRNWNGLLSDARRSRAVRHNDRRTISRRTRKPCFAKLVEDQAVSVLITQIFALAASDADESVAEAHTLSIDERIALLPTVVRNIADYSRNFAASAQGECCYKAHALALRRTGWHDRRRSDQRPPA